jgi:hypothetical protein
MFGRFASALTHNTREIAREQDSRVRSIMAGRQPRAGAPTDLMDMDDQQANAAGSNDAAAGQPNTRAGQVNRLLDRLDRLVNAIEKRHGVVEISPRITPTGSPQPRVAHGQKSLKTNGQQSLRLNGPNRDQSPGRGLGHNDALNLLMAQGLQLTPTHWCSLLRLQGAPAFAETFRTALVALGRTIDGVPAGTYTLPDLFAKVFNKMGSMQQAITNLTTAMTNKDDSGAALILLRMEEKLDAALGKEAEDEQMAAEQRKLQRKAARLAEAKAKENCGEHNWERFTEEAKQEEITKAKEELLDGEVMAASSHESDLLDDPAMGAEDDAHYAGDAEEKQVSDGSYSKDRHIMQQRRHIPKSKYTLPTPAKFNGNLDKNITCPTTWITALSEFLSQHDEDFITRFRLHLEGDALKWAMSLYDSLERNDELNADTVKQEFLLAYGNKLTPDYVKARDKLKNTNQANGV